MARLTKRLPLAASFASMICGMLMVICFAFMAGCQGQSPTPASVTALNPGAPVTETQFQAFLDNADPGDHGNASLQLTKVGQQITASSAAQVTAGMFPPYGPLILGGISTVLGLVGTVLGAKAHGTATAANATANTASTIAATGTAAPPPSAGTAVTLTPLTPLKTG